MKNNEPTFYELIFKALLFTISLFIIVFALGIIFSPPTNAMGYPNWAYDWKKVGAKLTRVNKLVSKDKVQQMCPRKGFIVEACSVRTGKSCIVYHWRAMTDRIDKHEQKHCDGFTHSRMDKLNIFVNYGNNMEVN